MQQVVQRGYSVPSLRCSLRLARCRVPAHRHRSSIRTQCGSIDPNVETVPQRVSAALRSRQDIVQGLENKLQASDASQEVVREVVHEFRSLHEQVQQLAQHLEALDNKAQAKAAEKALKKERKTAEKTLKKEKKAAEKAAVNGTDITTGFHEDSPENFQQELNNMVVSTIGGDPSFDMAHLGSSVPQLDNQSATSTPTSTAGNPSAVTISVCQGKDCKKQGADKLLQYVQSTAGPELNVVGCKCLGKCEQAPNLRVEVPEQKAAIHTTVQHGKEVQDILTKAKAQYGESAMKSFAVAS